MMGVTREGKLGRRRRWKEAFGHTCFMIYEATARGVGYDLYRLAVSGAYRMSKGDPGRL